MNQDLKLFLMVPKQEKIAAVRLIENQEERPLTPSLDAQKEFFWIAIYRLSDILRTIFTIENFS